MDSSVPYIDTRFDIRNTYNLMVVIKINDARSFDSMSNIVYQIRMFQDTSTVFNFFATQFVGTGFLTPGHVLICDNAAIHVTEEMM